MDTIYVFWTGGWDSSYRIVELSRELRGVIQPVYILDKNRNSNQYEQNAIKKITNALKERDDTVSQINDPIIIAVEDIPENKDISEAAARLKDQFGLGIQHDWTARVALSYPGIEMCIEKALPGSEYTPIRDILTKHAKLIMTSHGEAIDPSHSDSDVKLVFENIVLPIFEISEPEMLENVKRWGYMDVMKNIWFCHRPIHGKPCGICSPCHTKLDSKMEFLVPDDAQKRAKRVAAIEKRFGTKVCRIYKRIVYRLNCS